MTLITRITAKNCAMLKRPTGRSPSAKFSYYAIKRQDYPRITKTVFGKGIPQHLYLRHHGGGRYIEGWILQPLRQQRSIILRGFGHRPEYLARKSSLWPG